MKRVLVGLLFFLAVTTARAEVVVVDSLEWMAVDAPLVVRGKVAQAEDSKEPRAVTYRDVTITVEEPLKGKPQGKTIQVRLRLLGGDRTGKDWQAGGHSFLFFLRQGETGDDKALAGHWVLREDRQSVIDLDRPERVFKADIRHARTADEILKLARTYAAHQSQRVVGAPNVFKPQRGYLRRQIPPEAEIFKDVFAGSTCYLNVPAEEQSPRPPR